MSTYQTSQENKASGSIITGIYQVGCLLSFMIFSYQYAREHGFFAWLFFGEIVPALKSVAWPVFLLMGLAGK